MHKFNDAFEHPFSSWLVALPSTDLKSKPVSRKIMGEQIVFYRDSKGKAHALENICPHKQALLSEGRVINDNIQCPYHGWEFGGDGKCKNIPSLPKEHCSKNKAVTKTYEVHEDARFIWVYWGKEKEDFKTEFAFESKYSWFDYQYEIDAPVFLVLDNAFDCSHTGYVHQGLFRNEPNQLVESKIETKGNHLKVTTKEKKKKNSLAMSLIPGGKNEMQHTDEYFAPFSVVVNYRLGKVHHITYLFCTPISESKTRVFISCGLYVPLWTWPFKFIIQKITNKVVKQDIALLSQQAIGVQSTKRSMAFLQESDRASKHLLRLYKGFFRQQQEIEKGEDNVQYLL
jgi:phenylpropionate dioxygenase-like ring-hydroxylating dioxygenase large terminal subunit